MNGRLLSGKDKARENDGGSGVDGSCCLSSGGLLLHYAPLP